MTYALLKRPKGNAANTAKGCRTRSPADRSAPTGSVYLPTRPDRGEDPGETRSSTVRPQPGELRFGAPGDAVEREADRVADEVVAHLRDGSPAPKGRTVLPAGRQGVVLRETTTGADAATSAPPDFSRKVRFEQVHRGRPLDPAIRVPMEDAFGRDFSRVQIHDDDRAAELTRTARARAFVFGNDVFFDRGTFKLHEAKGQRLLAHELAHVAQHRSAEPPTIRRAMAPQSSLGEVQEERRRAAADMRRLAGDPAESSEMFVAGDLLTAEEFLATVAGLRGLTPGTVAIRVSPAAGEHLVVPLSALTYDRAVPGQDELHRGYVFNETAEGRLWASKLDEAEENRKTSVAARRIVSSKKMILAFGAMGVTGTVGMGAGLLGAGLVTKFGGSALLAGVVGGGLGGATEGGLSSGALTLLDGGSLEQAGDAAYSGALVGGGVGAGLGGMGAFLVPRIQNLRFGGPKGAAFANEAAETGYTLWKPSLSGRGARRPPPRIPLQVEHLRSIPDVFAAASSREYSVAGAFRIWKGYSSKELPVQGYKLHVSATLENATDVAQVVLPELQRLKVPHKIAASKKDYSGLSGDGQGGKFVTVYPRSSGEARKLRLLLDKKLRLHGIRGRRNFVVVEGEGSLGLSGGVFTRYGANVRIPYGEKRLGLFKTNELGQAVDKMGQPILYRNKPLNLSEPFKMEEHENIMSLLYRDGVIEPDIRGRMKPEWAPPLK